MNPKFLRFLSLSKNFFFPQKQPPRGTLHEAAQMHKNRGVYLGLYFQREKVSAGTFGRVFCAVRTHGLSEKRFSCSQNSLVQGLLPFLICAFACCLKSATFSPLRRNAAALYELARLSVGGRETALDQQGQHTDLAVGKVRIGQRSGRHIGSRTARYEDLLRSGLRLFRLPSAP